MVTVGAVAFGVVLGWWFGSRPGRPGWLPVPLAVVTGAVAYANTGATGLPATATGLLAGAGAALVFRRAVRAAGPDQGEEIR